MRKTGRDQIMKSFKSQTKDFILDPGDGGESQKLIE